MSARASRACQALTRRKLCRQPTNCDDCSNLSSCIFLDPRRNCPPEIISNVFVTYTTFRTQPPSGLSTHMRNRLARRTSIPHELSRIRVTGKHLALTRPLARSIGLGKTFSLWQMHYLDPLIAVGACREPRLNTVSPLSAGMGGCADILGLNATWWEQF